MAEAFDIRWAAKDEVQSLDATQVGVALEGETAMPEGYAWEASESASMRDHEC